MYQLGTRGSHDLIACIKAYLRYLRESQTGLSAERRRWVSARADREELDLRAKNKELVDAALVRKGLDSVCLSFRSILLGVSSLIGREIDQSDIRLRVTALVDRRIREALEVMGNFDPKIDPNDEDDLSPPTSPETSRKKTKAPTRNGKPG